MNFETESGTEQLQRRRFLRLCGGVSATVGGLSLLSACGSDGIVDSSFATNAPLPTPSATSTVTYTATDSDRMNFALQLHYLLAAYLQRSLTGGTLAASLTGGTGTAGAVSSGRQVTFSDMVLLAKVREVAAATTARIGFLRRTLGSAVTAQPAINIAGGSGSAFQAISTPISTTSTPTTFFDPYASENDFLLGATALTGVTRSAVADLAWSIGTSFRAAFGALTGGASASDSLMRNALFERANAEPVTPPAGQMTLFARADAAASARNAFDGPVDRDSNIGSFSGTTDVNANITNADGNGNLLRRTPEQTLGVLYNSARSVASGGFFPAGVNGTIRLSGTNNIV